MLKQPPDLPVSTVATEGAPYLVLQVIEHGGSAQTCRSDGETQTDVGGGKSEAAAAVRVVGRGAIVPPSHAGAHSIPRIAECVGSFCVVRPPSQAEALCLMRHRGRCTAARAPCRWALCSTTS